MQRGTRKTIGKTSGAASRRLLLTRGVADVIVRATLQKKLATGIPLRVKFGVDPTAPDLHLGHAVVLWKLREFQERGHTVVLIIGDATVEIGDPSGKSKVRPRLSPDVVGRNAETILAQLGRVLDTRRCEIRRNSEWFQRMTFSELVRLAEHFTVARLTERDDVQQRLRGQRDVYLHELFYPVLQAYDSVVVAADVEIGGTDQLFNMLAGRDLQRKHGVPEQDVMTVPLLVGSDGTEKMSKSLGNALGITEPPAAMFGKLMAIPDRVLSEYARLAARWDDAALARLPLRVAEGENPRDVKADIAEDTVALYHGGAAARQAREDFSRVFRDRELPREMPTVTVSKGPWDPVLLLVSLECASSKSDARRLITQGGVRIDGARVGSSTEPVMIHDGMVVRVGKRAFVRLRVRDA